MRGKSMWQSGMGPVIDETRPPQTFLPVRVKKTHPDAIVPRYQTDGAAGFDLHAAEDMIIGPGEWALIPTGLAFEIPRGYEMQIRPRSGVSAKTKLRIANSPATIDCDYRGEVFVLIENIHPRNETLDHDVQRLDGTYAFLDIPIRENSCLIEKGDRIAQGVVQAVPRAQFEVVDALSETERGDGGFGSTGVGAVGAE